VIPTYRREGVLVDTLRQVLAQDPPADEVLVVDQTPDAEHEAETLAFLRDQAACGRIRWIRQFPANLPAARNRALAETSCEIVIFIDDDVILSPGFVAAHVANYSDPRVTAVAGQILDSDRKTVSELPKPARRRRFGWLHFPLNYDKRAFVVGGRGCNFSVRREAALAIGCFDPNYTGRACREESDFFLRLGRAGGMCVFDPRASLVHIGWLPGGCNWVGWPQKGLMRSDDVACETYFWLKNYEPHVAAAALVPAYARWFGKLLLRARPGLWPRGVASIMRGFVTGLARLWRTSARERTLPK